VALEQPRQLGQGGERHAVRLGRVEDFPGLFDVKEWFRDYFSSLASSGKVVYGTPCASAGLRISLDCSM
jgi:hypothetical protein